MTTLLDDLAAYHATPLTDGEREAMAELERDARPTSAKAHLHDCWDIPWLVLDYLTADEAETALHDLIAVEGDTWTEKARMERIICARCAELGLVSVVTEGPMTMTLMHATYRFGEDGRPHLFEPNVTTTTYRCSRGHVFQRVSRADAPMQTDDGAPTAAERDNGS